MEITAYFHRQKRKSTFVHLNQEAAIHNRSRKRHKRRKESSLAQQEINAKSFGNILKVTVNNFSKHRILTSAEESLLNYLKFGDTTQHNLNNFRRNIIQKNVDQHQRENLNFF